MLPQRYQQSPINNIRWQRQCWWLFFLIEPIVLSSIFFAIEQLSPRHCKRVCGSCEKLLFGTGRHSVVRQPPILFDSTVSVHQNCAGHIGVVPVAYQRFVGRNSQQIGRPFAGISRQPRHPASQSLPTCLYIIYLYIVWVYRCGVSNAISRCASTFYRLCVRTTYKQCTRC